VAEHETFGFGLCATLLREGLEFIGRCGIEPRVEADGKMAGALAWMFLPEYWGQGLGVETGQGLHRVYAKSDHGNRASIIIMQRLGMQLVRETDQCVEYEIRP
ncbi:MAG: GNAT family N-acetyltransferase, partial [Pirellulaceae bacterium]